jgi:hypothetical protein
VQRRTAQGKAAHEKAQQDRKKANRKWFLVGGANTSLRAQECVCVGCSTAWSTREAWATFHSTKVEPV